MLGEKEHRKWKFADVGQWLKNAFFAMLKGEFLLRLNISKYFIHIIYTFLLFWVSIYLSLKIEKTMTRVETGRKALEDIEIAHTQKTIELVSMGRMSKVQDMLRAQGSTLDIPEEPAARIKK
jgi:hypothetical protein